MTTYDINKDHARQIVLQRGITIEEATCPDDLGHELVDTLNRNNLIWSFIEDDCELGDNNKLYLRWRQGDFVVVNLKKGL